MESEHFESFFLALNKHEHASYAALIPLLAPDSVADSNDNKEVIEYSHNVTQQTQQERQLKSKNEEVHISSREGDNEREASQLDNYAEYYNDKNSNNYTVSVNSIINENNFHENIGQTHVENNSIFRSFLTSLSNPSEALLIVLDNCDIALYTFSSPTSLPPPPTGTATASSSSELLSAQPNLLRRFGPSEMFDSVTKSKHMQMDPPEVTCVSLFPLELAHHCRVDLRGRYVNTTENALSQNAEDNDDENTTTTTNNNNNDNNNDITISNESNNKLKESNAPKELIFGNKTVNVDVTNQYAFCSNADNYTSSTQLHTPILNAPLAEELAEIVPVHVNRLRHGTGETHVAHTYLRGIVGNSYGRVSVFSERGYAFSFSAHDAPVWRAEAIYFSEVNDNDCFDTERHCDAEQTAHIKTCNAHSNNNNNDNIIDDNYEHSSHPQEHHKVQDTSANALTLQRQSGVSNKPHTLRSAMQHLGFVTASIDGTIFIWRRHNNYLEPNILAEPGVFTRHIAFNTYLPPSSDWMLNPFLTNSNHENVTMTRNGAGPLPCINNPSPSPSSSSSSTNHNNASKNVNQTTPNDSRNVNTSSHSAPLYSSIMLHSVSSLRHGVRLRSVDDEDYVSSQVDNYYKSKSSANVFTLPRAMLTYTTAIAAEASFALIAREKQLYALDYDSGEFTLIMTATKQITEIVLAEPIAVAVCAHEGLVYLIQLHPFAVLSKYRSYKKRPILSVTLCIHHLLMIITDSHGSVELIRIPSTYITEQAPELGMPSKITLPLYSVVPEFDLVCLKQRQQQQQQQQHQRLTQSLQLNGIKQPVIQPQFVLHDNEPIGLTNNY